VDRFIEEMYKWSGAEKPAKVLDVGCGIGGTSRYLAKKLSDSEVTGITLSPKQVERATALAKEKGLPNVNFRWDPVLAVIDGPSAHKLRYRDSTTFSCVRADAEGH